MANKKRVTESKLKDLFYDTVRVLQGQLNGEDWAREVDSSTINNAIKILKDNNIQMDFDHEVEDDLTRASKELPAFNFDEYAIN